MAVASRKTHMVRIQAPKSTKKEGDPGPAYVDIEVLDCVAYRTTNGKVHVWDCQSLNADPFVDDKTGDDPNRSTGSETSSRGSHAKQFVVKAAPGSGNPDKVQFDYEVLDRMGFKDDQNKVWILDYPLDSSDPFNSTTHQGGEQSTRRTHLEQINATYTSGGTGGVEGKRVGAFGKDNTRDNKKNDGTFRGCIVQERVDIVAFQGEYEKRLVINLTSFDNQDPDNADAEKARAVTITDPPDYDPDNKDGPKPPLLEETQDKNFYFKLIVDHSKGGPVFVIGGSGYAWSATIVGGPNNGDTFTSLPIFNTGAQALADFEANNVHGGFDDPVIVFVKGKPVKIGDNPPGDFLRELDTGTIGKNNGKKGTFVSMGPVWWIRKWSPDGTN